MDPRKRRRLVGRLLAGAALLGVAVLIAFGFVPKPVEVTVGKVERRSLEVTVDETGKTRLRSKYVISAPGIGQLERITLRAGDIVQENQVVAQLAPVAPQLLDERTRAEAAARVAVARANLARAQTATKRAETALGFARDQAVRSRKLHAQGGASQQGLEQAEYQERSADQDYASAHLGERVSANELAAAQAALASTRGERGQQDGRITLIAPVGGQVLRVYQESEGVVQSGTPLLEIGDPRALEIVVDVLSTDAVRIEVGTPARIERWGGDHPLAARVRRKEPSAFTTRSALGVEEQRVPVVLDLVDVAERWLALGDGYKVEAHIRVVKIDDAVVAPTSALFREDGAWKAFVLQRAKKSAHAKKTTLEAGARTPDWVEVKRGVAPGEDVVLYPSDRVEDGVKLAPQSAPRG